MSSGHFLLVKYVPDRARSEPINIGIIVKGNGLIKCHFEEKAFQLVKQRDPYADLEGLEFLQRYYDDVLSGESGQDVLNNLPNEPSRKLTFTDPLFVDLEGETEQHLDETLSRLNRRLIMPLKKVRGWPKPTEVTVSVRDAFKQLALRGVVQRNVTFRGATGYSRHLDVYFQNGKDWGLKAVNLDYARQGTLRKTVESAALEIYDVRKGSSADLEWIFMAVCHFPRQGYEEAREFADKIFALVGADVYDVARELESSLMPRVRKALGVL